MHQSFVNENHLQNNSRNLLVNIREPKTSGAGAIRVSQDQMLHRRRLEGLVQG
jgi:hypothetical protein